MEKFKKRPQKIPYAVANFEQIRRDGFYYVDKTPFIRELENYQVPVFLRPRRFGKTLWCSLLECYYDINRKEEFAELFKGLSIGEEPTGTQSSFMVMRFNFSKVQVTRDMDDLSRNFSAICFSAIQLFLGLYRNFFHDAVTLQKDEPVANLINSIFEYALENRLPQIYIIIDEYDNFTNQLITAHRDDLYDTITTGDSFFRTFFKVMKTGIESRAAGRVFITGVLPITMDDLTSGFNIAEIVTLKKHLHNMLGFTEGEVAQYLQVVFEENQLDISQIPEIRQIMKSYYNGYRFLPEAEDTLYNSTIISYFLKNYLLDGGEIPRDMIDPNVKTDVSWIRRLSGGDETAPLKLLEKLVNGEGLSYDETMLSDKFNMNQFFDKDFYPVSLFYLGMLTVKNRFDMNFPNQTLTKIFVDYYNTLAHIEVSKGYTDYFRQFLKDSSLTDLFKGYFRTYIGQIPAQAFDKINENFIRTTFFELCTRYLSRDCSFAIEKNYPSGRSDWEMLGRHGGQFSNQKWIVEFKYLKKGDKQLFDKISCADNKDIKQVESYAKDTLLQFPSYTIHKYICYVCGNLDFKMFKI